VGDGSGDIAPEVGVTGTPVIDPSTETLYVVSKSLTPRDELLPAAARDRLIQRQREVFGAGYDCGHFSRHGRWRHDDDFCATTTESAAWPGPCRWDRLHCLSSHEDDPPYYGWVMGYDAATLAQKYVSNISPNVQWGGIWMNGDAPAVDADATFTTSPAMRVTTATAPGRRTTILATRY